MPLHLPFLYARFSLLLVSRQRQQISSHARLNRRSPIGTLAQKEIVFTDFAEAPMPTICILLACIGKHNLYFYSALYIYLSSVSLSPRRDFWKR